MRALLFVLLLFLVSFPCYCYAWTGREWMGVVEAVTGTVVLKARSTPSSDTCENCSGTGRLGDGTVSVECPVCDGTGKHATMKVSPSPSRKKVPTVEQEAVPHGGGTYKRRVLRRR